MNFSKLGIVSATVASLALSACTNGTHGVTASTGSAQAGLTAQRQVNEAVARHGREVEQGTTVMVTEGNNHMVFPGNAVVTRNSDGVTVTVAGKVSKFSKDAKVDTSGIYHKYAAR